MATGFQPNALQNSAFQTPSLPAFQFNDSQGNAFQTFSLGTSYYWVGGSGTWDATTTTNWALSSGGAGSAGVPTSGDTAIFDTLSNAISYTVTKVAGAVTGDLNASGPLAGSVSFAGVGVSVYGDFTLAATGVTWSAGGITFASTATGKNITTNGVTLAAVTFNGVGGGWTLGSAFTTAAFTLTAGTFVTSNFAVTFTNFTSTSTSVRGLTLGSSLVTVTAGGTSTIWNVTNPGNLTVTPGTSTIRCTAATGKVFSGGVVTYYNLDQGGAGYLQIATNSTFNDIQNSYVATGATSIRIQSTTLTVANFTATGTVGKVLSLISSAAGTARTLTKTGGGTISVDYMSIQDSTVTGTGASWYAGANSTDLGNNTGWIFTAPPGGGITVPVTSVTGTGAIGTVTVTGTALVQPTGVVATAAIGTVTVALTLNVPVTGVSATAAIGTVTVTGTANTPVTGVVATGAIGTVTVNTAGNVTVIVTGVQATAAIGTVTVAIVTGITVLATGVQAIGAIGTVTVSTGQPVAQGGGGGKRPFIYEEAIDVPTKIVIRVNSEVAVRGVSSKIRVGWAQVAATQSVTAEARSVLAVAKLSMVEACEVQNCLVEAGAVYGTTRASRAYVKSIQNLSDDALMLLLLAI